MVKNFISQIPCVELEWFYTHGRTGYLVYVFHIRVLDNVLYLSDKPSNANLSVCSITCYYP